MGKRRNLLVAVLVVCYAVAVVGFYEEREKGEEMFLLHEMRHVVKTDAGDMKVVKGFGGRVGDKPIEVGFITMEPKTLFIPQYLDSDLIIFIRRGIQNDFLTENLYIKYHNNNDNDVAVFC